MPSSDKHRLADPNQRGTAGKLLAATEKETTLSRWIVGGPLGSKDAMLVFRVSALSTGSALREPNDSDQKSCDHIPQHLKDIGELEELTQLPAAKPTTRLMNVATKRCGVSKLKPSISEQSIERLSRGGGGGGGSRSQSKSMITARGMYEIKTGSLQNLSSSSKMAADEEDTLIVDKSKMPAAELNITYKFANTETRLLRKILHGHGLEECDDTQNFNLLWTGVHLKPDILRNLLPYQRVNHFPRSSELTRKDRLCKNIEKMQHLRGFKHFDIVPQSFIYPLESRELASEHNKYRGPWIVKPVASSRGRGIYLVNSPDQIPLDENVVVAKYVTNPLCIDGHKCDIRVYVAVTSFDPLLIYLYEEGLVRLATVKYNRKLENLWNPCMHLCNYSINKYHSDYIKSEDAGAEDVGHKWTLSALLRHLRSQGYDTATLMANIEEVIVKAIFACTQSIVSACRMFVPNGSNCFELYGFDILIDDTLKPWLLEINLSPSLGIDTPLDAKVKSAMLTDLLNLVGIPAVTPLLRAAFDQKCTKMKVWQGRRSNSADVAINVQTQKLSGDEQRILRTVRAQEERRGGFARIFPFEDSMSKYSAFMDPITGVPISTMPTVGTGVFSMIIPHNYNQMVHAQLYQNRESVMPQQEFLTRMAQYERTIETSPLAVGFPFATQSVKCEDKARLLRRQLRRLIETGTELSKLQSRKTFSAYLESVLRRLTAEPKLYHEKLILKFIYRTNISLRTPLIIRNLAQYTELSKDRSALVAKQLADYLEVYNRETEAYVDRVDHIGFVPAKLFYEFLDEAQEADLESILTLHTNISKQMPFLYNPCGNAVPTLLPIPSGLHGFLKALPNMAPGLALRDVTKSSRATSNSGGNVRPTMRSIAKVAN